MKTAKRMLIRSMAVQAVVLAASLGMGQTSADFAATADATIYSDHVTDNGGGGADMYAGRTSGSTTDGIRRSLIRFDLSSIPTNATVTAATLKLQITKVPPGSTAIQHTISRVQASWVEGTGTATGSNGATVAGAVSWTSSGGSNWTNPGGDFVATASASVAVGTSLGQVQYSSAGVISDVQAWVTNPATNFGWEVRGDESVNSSVRIYATHDSFIPANRPVLSVTYSTSSAVRDWMLYR
jgi:hypothetical protein